MAWTKRQWTRRGLWSAGLLVVLASGAVAFQATMGGSDEWLDRSTEEKIAGTQQMVTEDELQDFCGEAQGLIATTDLKVTNILYDEFKEYTASKPEVTETDLKSSQFVLYEVDPKTDTPYSKIVSCKFKSADRIQTFRGDDAAGPQKSCGDINRQTVETVIANLGLTEEALPKIVFDEDDPAMIGPQWLSPWPYQVAYWDQDATLHVRAKGMLIPYSELIPMPDEFKGVHYCHMIAPGYVKRLLTSGPNS